MNRKSILLAAQIAVAVFALVIVYFSIHVHDAFRRRVDKQLDRNAVEAPWIDCDILGPDRPEGPWGAPVVEFRIIRNETTSVPRVEDSKPAVETRPTPEFEFRPGIITLYKYMAMAPYLAGAALLLFGAYIASVRWWLLTRVLKIPFSIRAALKWSFVGFFFNNAVPGLIGGDLPKMYYVARTAPIKTHAVLTVIVDRLLGLFGLAIVASVAFLIDFNRYAEKADLWWIQWLLFGVLAGLVVGVVFIVNSRIRHAVFPPHRVAKMPGGKILTIIDEAVVLYGGSPKTLLTCLFLSIGNHVLSMIAWWFFVAALHGKLALGATFVVVPIIQMIKSVPLAPAGWGVGELAFNKLLPLYGESGTAGVALSITYNLTYLAFSLVGGFILLTARDRVSAAEMQESLEH
ncbi:MAG: flippase-like domain-containing protein [Planctomycetes bacterium]|nr:flippase-like domain-containing protein [Planctomycetota bacterium]